MSWPVKIIRWSFYLLLFTVPLIFLPNTSELFEFNKMIITYLFTILITLLWLIKMIAAKKIIFRKTPLDIFLIVFFLSQLVSTLFSVDTRTSFLGYYSRFHGGLTSTISYLVLYWAFVSNMDRRKTLKAIYFLLSSAAIVSVWAILEHFGKSLSCLLFSDYSTFDVSCWVQDVATRVFATFGQPNWLAAWIITLIPITWVMTININSETKKYHRIIFIFLSLLFFTTLLYTKSRSGILAFFIMTIIFWSVTFFAYIKNKASYSELTKKFLILNSLFLILIFIIGTPWTPNISQLLSKSPSPNLSEEKLQGPALEVGGTESGQIRKIVWKGAMDIWKKYPLFGTGVETFAFSYYKFRPVDHNLVSEWNFLYNKAHNEYLNFAATTGTFGLLSYITLIIFSLFQIYGIKPPFLKRKQENSHNNRQTENANLDHALGAGYISILVTNFFGFSVVPIALIFFLFPAIAVCLETQKPDEEKLSEERGELSNSEIAAVSIAILGAIFLVNLLWKYWYADYLYARGQIENQSGLYLTSRNTLLAAIKLSPKESVFWDELSGATGSLAAFYADKNDTDTAHQLAEIALTESDKAISLSSQSVILKKTRVRMLADLSLVDALYMKLAERTLIDASKLAPTDAHIFYNLAITYFKNGDMQAFVDTIKKTVEMKPNYKEARLALAQYYKHEGRIEEAKNELRYILDNIARDPETEKELADLENNSE